MNSRGMRSVAMAAAQPSTTRTAEDVTAMSSIAAQAVSRVGFTCAFVDRHGPLVGAAHAGQCLSGRDGAAGQVQARLDPQPGREPHQCRHGGDLGQVVQQESGPVVAAGEAEGAEAPHLLIGELPDTGMGVGSGDVQPQGDWGAALRGEVFFEDGGGGAGAVPELVSEHLRYAPRVRACGE